MKRPRRTAPKPPPPPKPMLPGIRPMCRVCGWAKGGLDSWDGVACKCGLTEPPIELVQ